MLIDHIFRRIARYPALHRAIKPIGGPIYRALLNGYYHYAGWRAGLRFPAGLAPATGVQYATGRFEPETTALLRQRLRPGMVCVDIGANVGYYTRLAAQLVGSQGRVIACEPEPENLHALRHNTRQFPQVSLVSAALADKRGLLPLYLSSHSSCHSLVDQTYFKDGSLLWVPTLLFDDLRHDLALDFIDLVKIDVEGAEPLVLAGMADSLARRLIGALIVEFSPQNICGAGLDLDGLVKQLLSAFEDIRVFDAPVSTLINRSLRDESAFYSMIDILLQQPQRGYVNLLCAVGVAKPFSPTSSTPAQLHGAE